MTRIEYFDFASLLAPRSSYRQVRLLRRQLRSVSSTSRKTIYARLNLWTMPRERTWIGIGVTRTGSASLISALHVISIFAAFAQPHICASVVFLCLYASPCFSENSTSHLHTIMVNLAASPHSSVGPLLSNSSKQILLFLSLSYQQ